MARKKPITTTTAAADSQESARFFIQIIRTFRRDGIDELVHEFEIDEYDSIESAQSRIEQMQSESYSHLENELGRPEYKIISKA